MKTFVCLCLLGAVFNQAVAQPALPPATVVTDQVKLTSVVATVPVTGHVISQNAIQLTAAITGQLVEVAEPGTRVQRGDVVARFDTLGLELQQQEQQALIERAEAQLNYLQANLKRQQGLVNAKSVSQNVLEETRSQRDVAQSDLRVAQLRLRQIEDQLEKSVIRAGHDGVISQRNRREGETVAQGSVIGVLTDLDNLEVRAMVPLRYSVHVAVGQQVDIYAHERQLNGVVKSVVPAADLRSQAQELRLQLNREANLSVGQLVSVSVPVHAARESLVVNQDALVLRADGIYVFRVKEGNTVEQIEVQTHENVGDFIAIDGPLQPGDHVVVRGADGLNEGRAVSVQNPVQAEA